MASRSLTLSEQLAVTYTKDTGAATPYRFLYNGLADCKGITREQSLTLSKAITVTRKSIFGAEDFTLATDTGLISVEKVAPQIGPRVGWGRYPGLDHWHVMRDGKTVFRSQNYRAVLRYCWNVFARSEGKTKRAA